MNDKGISSFDNSIDEELAAIATPPRRISSRTPTNDGKSTKNLTEAEKLLVTGRFVEAKRVFAKKGDSDMAQLCSKLIESKRTVCLYQNILEETKTTSQYKSANKSLSR